MREVVAGELAQLRFGCLRSGPEDHKRLRDFSPFFVRQPDNGNLQHRRMPQQSALDFNGRNILPTADDDILEPVTNFEVIDQFYFRSVATPSPFVSGNDRTKICEGSRPAKVLTGLPCSSLVGTALS